MEVEAHQLKIVLILAVGFGLASLLGYLAQILKLSPILGYLIGGYLIGPFSPGYVADAEIAEQLAEIGVVLMMFGVGMHFKWEELSSVKGIAIPGAIGQTLVTILITTLLVNYFGWSLETGLILGMAIGVASTAVLIRVLSDNKLLATPEGHIAVGWLIVEDIFTVMALILLPAIAASSKGESLSFQDISIALGGMLFKFALLIGLMFTIGKKFVKYALFKVARTRSHELFTLTVLALTFAVATGSALIFGTSIALGAFIAGMVVGQTEVRQQATANSLPLKDTFVVIFFLAIGMLFNPAAIFSNFPLFLGIITIILVVKPLVAFLIVIFFRYPFKIALTVALSLAQIGEFSLILGEEATKLDIMPDDAYDLIVACVLVSISVNPLFFKLLEFITNYVQNKIYPMKDETLQTLNKESSYAVIIGFGPVGQNVESALQIIGFKTFIVERNVDTVVKLREENREAIFGDASLPNILEAAHVNSATLLVITVPEVSVSVAIIKIAKELHPRIKIYARARYAEDKVVLKDLGVDLIYCEEEEAKRAFTDVVVRKAERLMIKMRPKFFSY